MSQSNLIILKAGKFVNDLFDRKSTIAALYHNFDHTLEVVANVKEIAAAMDLSHDKMEMIVIAAWFHDTGYLFTPDEHEERSVTIASDFLKKEGYPASKIKEIAECIRATKVPQRPKNLMQKVMADADLLNLGKKDSIEKGELLRTEIENLSGKSIGEKEWIKQSITFFHDHHYHTTYAITHYSENREKNMRLLQQRLIKLNAKKKSPKKVSSKKKVLKK